MKREKVRKWKHNELKKKNSKNEEKERRKRRGKGPSF